MKNLPRLLALLAGSPISLAITLLGWKFPLVLEELVFCATLLQVLTVWCHLGLKEVGVVWELLLVPDASLID